MRLHYFSGFYIKYLKLYWMENVKKLDVPNNTSSKLLYTAHKLTIFRNFCHVYIWVFLILVKVSNEIFLNTRGNNVIFIPLHMGNQNVHTIPICGTYFNWYWHILLMNMKYCSFLCHERVYLDNIRRFSNKNLLFLNVSILSKTRTSSSRQGKFDKIRFHDT